jgi:hypothetical protein
MKAQLINGLFKAMVAARGDRCNRWYVKECLCCDQRSKKDDRLFGLCEPCWEEIRAAIDRKETT